MELYDAEEEQADLINMIDLMTVTCAMLMLLLPTISIASIKVDLSETSHSEQATDAPQETSILTFSATGDLSLDGESVDFDGLDAKLAVLSDEQKTVRLAGDREAPLGLSIRLWAKLAEHEIPAKLLVQEEQKE